MRRRRDESHQYTGVCRVRSRRRGIADTVDKAKGKATEGSAKPSEAPPLKASEWMNESWVSVDG